MRTAKGRGVLEAAALVVLERVLLFLLVAELVLKLLCFFGLRLCDAVGIAPWLRRLQQLPRTYCPGRAVMRLARQVLASVPQRSISLRM